MVMNPDTSAEHAHELLRKVLPDLRIGNISKLGEGWDSIAVVIDNSIVFRIPKRLAASHQMVKEIRVLEAIRPYVSAKIPNIEWIGERHGHFPVAAVGYRKLTGTPLFQIPLGPTREHALQELGEFLRELHAVPTSEQHTADVPWFRWTGDSSLTGSDSWEVGLRGFTNRIRDNIVPLLNLSVGKAVIESISEFLACPQHFQFKPVLIHGDLAPEHILVDVEVGNISVIDFGDCGMGDPAYDVWTELIPWYNGQVDESFHTRQRFYRKLAPFHGVLYGMMTRGEALVADGLRTVEAEFGGEI